MRLCAILLLSFTAACPAQPPASLPTDLKAILLALKDANGINLQPSVPWHLTLSWDEFDNDGDNVHSGTIEEFYAGPKRYRLFFKGDSFNQTQVATASGLFLSSPGEWPPVRALQALEFVTSPLSRLDDEPSNVRLEAETKQIGGVTLSCIKALRRGVIEMSAPDYCYTPSSLQLRFNRAPALDALIYNNTFTFRSRFIGGKIDAYVGGKPILKVHVDKLEDLAQPDAALFVPGSGQLPVPSRMKVPSSLLVIEKRGELEPNGKQGTAVVAFVVGKDGRVIDARATSGPADIQKIALRAMRGFRFRPFLVLDQAIEVEGIMEFSCQ